MEYAYSILPKAGTSPYLDLWGCWKREMATAKFLLFLLTKEEKQCNSGCSEARNLGIFLFPFHIPYLILSTFNKFFGYHHFIKHFPYNNT